MMEYAPANWYWIIAGDDRQVYSSARASTVAGQIYINNATYLIRTKTSFTNNSAAATGTLTNAPAAGNPTKWIAIDDNGTTRYIPAW